MTHVSIVMTVYNRECYLGAAIESILAQTYPNFELIIWDDGSTDNSLNIARSYAKLDSRITALAAEHRGVSYSLMGAIRQSAFPYFGCVDSDDLLAPKALTETVPILDANPQVGVVYTNYLTIDENDCVSGEGELCKIPYSPEQLLVDPIVFHFRLIRRSAYNICGGVDPNFASAFDYELCLRLSEVTEIRKLDKPLYYYRIHRHNFSRQHRVEQILLCRTAVEQALQRRGLADKLELGVEVQGQFRLRSKQVKDKVEQSNFFGANANLLSNKSTASSPIFVLGAERSGTTLLRLMLTAHPDICIPPESLFFVALESKYGAVKDLLPQIEEFLNDLYNNNFHRFWEWNVDKKLLLNNLTNNQQLSYGRAVSTVYETYRQQFYPTASIWGDKNPFHIYQLGKIRRYFPGVKVILIVRDFRACYSSVKKLVAREQERGEVWPGIKTIAGLTHQWNQVVKIIEKYHQKWEQFYLVSYEDLVREPSAQLAKICKWVGVDFQSSMLDFYQKNADSGLVPPNQMVWHPNTLEPVGSDRINAWQDELSVSELETIELMNWKNLEKLGYKCTSLF
ncbi:MAG: sulfotransferase [Microcoleus sp. PH2017_29_MFU_D_A]|uniref:sulfotransferase n=1 Tax=unclassified Microcoleus TaxID=2642155 RepID=UPI001D5C5EF1|nr:MULTISPECIES: sulfotransferase [unclassified Microcoleus]MCC3416491.1 sulfotransferase [Microcoleus sp. PH2017_07_MST_O_A]MCC3507794.1 sulfotransferase [Microcoleus sp. PH2017_17_BER_D_A]TAG67884.1 MAG: glycosyltransferase [Oscillatoriales cyanobacterium]MCC3423819.1 sulfotransferase [Microcoleus sp. PH2017_01_SCD_O_A]MCC3452799.1 sulfotransferase [Microcoleus sp. PH2017_08_TRC_O_A]